MKFNKLIFENFRCFYGRHELELASHNQDGLVLVFGDNMSGKTGLFLAINWCLYGEAIGRRGEHIPIYRPGDRDNNFLINAKAVEMGDYRIYVRLEWEHDNHTWILDREGTCSGDPLTNSEFISKASLQIGNNVCYTQEIPKRINQILHYKASQFYFFDGELLSQYERWLESPQERETRVKRAIELTVGTAALGLHEEMKQVADEAENEQAKLVRKENRETTLLEQLEERENRQKQLRREIEDYIDYLAEQRSNADAIEKVHGALANYSQHLGRIQILERNVTRQKRRQDETEMEIRKLLNERYWLALSGVNERLRQSLIVSIAEFFTARDFHFQRKLLEGSLDDSNCKICHRPLDDHSSTRIATEVQKLRKTLVDDLDEFSVGDLMLRLKTLDRYDASPEMERLRLLEEKRLDARAEAAADAEEAQEIREADPNRPRGDHESEMARLKLIFDDIALTQTLLVQNEEESDSVADYITTLRSKLNRIEIDPSVLRKALAARLAADGTERALDEFREIAREKVEQHASQVFSNLVDEPGYGRIFIDSDYRVLPVNESGSVMPVPSAGGQQLLTLALVGGLNAAAVHDAPIIMDTPAGRIDRANRQRILRWLDGLTQQVVLMVHSGEFIPDEIVDSRVRVARAYQIKKTGIATSEVAEIEMV